MNSGNRVGFDLLMVAAGCAEPHDVLVGRRAVKGTVASFDHLIGAGEERGWDREAESLGGPEIDDQLDLGGLHDREVRRLLAFQDASLYTPI